MLVMALFRLGLLFALFLSIACSTSDDGDHPSTLGDASDDGVSISVGGAGGSAGSGTDGMQGGNGGVGVAGSDHQGGGGGNTGGTASTDGASGAGGTPGAPDAAIADATSTSPDSGPVDAGCRGTAAALCPTGEWQEYLASGAARCSACPGPTPTCDGFDLAASTFTAGPVHRIIKIALAPGAAEMLLDADIRVRTTFQGTTCGSNPIVSTFGKQGIVVEHDAAGRTLLSVDIGIINSTMVPCGDIQLVFNDGCCMARQIHLSAVYVEGSGATVFSCSKDAG
jgi:hypothetical protein